MNKVIIVDASDSDCRLMSGLLTRAGYEPVIAEDMEAAKLEVAKLNVSEKTVKRYRDAGKLEVYESIEGNIKFVLQSDLDRFLEQSFISSSHPEYRTVKRKS